MTPATPSPCPCHLCHCARQSGCGQNQCPARVTVKAPAAADPSHKAPEPSTATSRPTTPVIFALPPCPTPPAHAAACSPPEIRQDCPVQSSQPAHTGKKSHLTLDSASPPPQIPR